MTSCVDGGAVGPDGEGMAGRRAPVGAAVVAGGGASSAEVAGAGGEGSGLASAVTQVSAGYETTCARLNDGSLRCWGKAGPLLGYNKGELGHIGDDETPASAGPVPVTSSVVAVQVGGETCALLKTGSVRCWGLNNSGQLGLGHTDDIGDDESPASVPTVSLGGRAVKIATGLENVCAILEGGAVRCWGNNAFGQLGLGNGGDYVGDDEPPSSVPPVSLGGKAVDVSVFGGHACALLEGGDMRCWGDNRHGQLGLGHDISVGQSELPTAVGPIDAGGKVVQIAAGGEHTCALLEGGIVRCWGNNQYGQLGLGHADEMGDSEDEVPALVGPVNLGGKAAQIVAGAYHTCALLEGGAVRCWGNNEAGQLGIVQKNNFGDDEGEAPSSVAPVDVGGGATQLGAGFFHTCALLEGGTVRCWGINLFGELGLGHPESVFIGDDEAPASVPPASILADMGPSKSLPEACIGKSFAGVLEAKHCAPAYDEAAGQCSTECVESEGAFAVELVEGPPGVWSAVFAEAPETPLDIDRPYPLVIIEGDLIAARKIAIADMCPLSASSQGELEVTLDCAAGGVVQVVGRCEGEGLEQCSFSGVEEGTVSGDTPGLRGAAPPRSPLRLPGLSPRPGLSSL